MYTSEIRETDGEGKPVSVSPALLARVRETDEALRERVGTDSNFEYAGRWVFPGPEKAILSFTVHISNGSEAFTVSLPFNPRNVEWFSHQAVQSVLDQAGKVVQARLDRRLRDLRISFAGDEDNAKDPGRAAPRTERRTDGDEYEPENPH